MFDFVLYIIYRFFVCLFEEISENIIKVDVKKVYCDQVT